MGLIDSVRKLFAINSPSLQVGKKSAENTTTAENMNKVTFFISKASS